jgi:eukaryotic-like serine/threonine-protein kinase
VSSATAVMGGDQFGPFRFLERIERGGPAELYRALWAEAPVPGERSCLVKRLRPELASSPAFRRMFVEESRIMMYLRHPGVARVYAHGDIDGLPYVATEPLDGLSLARLLGASRASGRKLPIEVVAYIGQQLATTLAHAHQAADPGGAPLSIVHRDVRPANIMLLTDGQVKLVEFGVARMASFVSQSANLAGAGTMPGEGKACYASPEQLLGAPLDGRADLFSLGVSLWEMLVGRPLFPPGPPNDVAARVLQAPLPRPSAVRPDVPQAFDDLIGRLLDRDLGRRLASGGDVAAALAEFLPVPKDARRAVVSMVRTASSAPMELPGALPAATPGARPQTRVVPQAAALLAARGKMMALAGRLPGSIRRITGMVAPLVRSPPGGMARPFPPREVVHMPARWSPAGPSPMRRLALQAALAATLSFVAGVLWQEVRVDAAVARPPSAAGSPTTARNSGVLIERLPPRPDPGARSPSSPGSSAGKTVAGVTGPAARLTSAAASRTVRAKATRAKRAKHGGGGLPARRRHHRR